MVVVVVLKIEKFGVVSSGVLEVAVMVVVVVIASVSD